MFAIGDHLIDYNAGGLIRHRLFQLHQGLLHGIPATADVPETRSIADGVAILPVVVCPFFWIVRFTTLRKDVIAVPEIVTVLACCPASLGLEGICHLLLRQPTKNLRLDVEKMATNAPNNSTFRLTDTINFLEIPTITLRYNAPDGDCDDGPRPPFASSPLDEYRGAGSLSLRRIRTLGAPDTPRRRAESPSYDMPTVTASVFDPTFAKDRARSILLEARDAIARILGDTHPLRAELERLADGL